MAKPTLTRNRIILAFTVAVVADLLEFPITAAENLSLGTLATPAEGADIVLDCAVMAAMTRLLGFHWLFLPSFLVEVIPEIDLLPTWVGCVSYVVWQRKKEQAHAPPLPPVVEIHAAEVVDPPQAPHVNDTDSKGG